jgi:hypothetical protein
MIKTDVIFKNFADYWFYLRMEYAHFLLHFVSYKASENEMYY